MGLLDQLFYGGMQEQQGDPQGALLSELLKLQQPQQAPQQPLPTGHVMPQAPAQAPPAPNFLDRLSAMSRGYGEGGLVGGIADAFNLGDSRGERAQAQQRNATFEYLVPKVGEEAARAAMGNPELLKQVLKTIPGARSDEYSKNLVYGTDKDGNTIPLQAGTAGDLVASKMPDGVNLNAKPQMMDLGDRYAIFDPATRAIIGYQPKGLAEKARQEQVGEAQGKAQVNLPQVESAAARMLRQIDELEMHPALESITGTVGGRIPEGWQTEAMAEAQSRLNQIAGGTFLQAYNELRGGGAITEEEGKQAKASYTRLGMQTMGTPAYRKALQEAREETLKLVELAKRKAAGLGGAPAADGWTDVGGVRIRAKQ
jgi:hypothetical protein